jgi:hypothetical protein
MKMKIQNVVVEETVVEVVAVVDEVVILLVQKTATKSQSY